MCHVYHLSSATSAETTNFKATPSSSRTHFPLYCIFAMAMTLNFLEFSSGSIIMFLASSNVNFSPRPLPNLPIEGVNWVWSLSVMRFLAPAIACTIDATSGLEVEQSSVSSFGNLTHRHSISCNVSCAAPTKKVLQRVPRYGSQIQNKHPWDTCSTVYRKGVQSEGLKAC